MEFKSKAQMVGLVKVMIDSYRFSFSISMLFSFVDIVFESNFSE